MSGIAKSIVGLGSVDDTSDLSKPLSRATQSALFFKANALDTYTKAQIDAITNNTTSSVLPQAVDATGLFFGLSNNATTNTFDVDRHVVIQNSPTEILKILRGAQVNGDIRTTMVRAYGAEKINMDEN